MLQKTLQFAFLQHLCIPLTSGCIQAMNKAREVTSNRESKMIDADEKTKRRAVEFWFCHYSRHDDRAKMPSVPTSLMRFLPAEGCQTEVLLRFKYISL